MSEKQAGKDQLLSHTATKHIHTGIVFNKDKTVQHQSVLKKRMLPMLWKYCGVLPSHSLQEVIFWATIHQKEHTSSFEKTTHCMGQSPRLEGQPASVRP